MWAGTNSNSKDAMLLQSLGLQGPFLIRDKAKIILVAVKSHGLFMGTRCLRMALGWTVEAAFAVVSILWPGKLSGTRFTCLYFAIPFGYALF